MYKKKERPDCKIQTLPTNKQHENCYLFSLELFFNRNKFHSIFLNQILRNFIFFH